MTVRRVPAAAMEPRRDDGDDCRVELRLQGRAIRAAMEPRRDDGDDVMSTRGIDSMIRAAMEPRRDDGDDPPR